MFLFFDGFDKKINIIRQSNFMEFQQHNSSADICRRRRTSAKNINFHFIVPGCERIPFFRAPVMTLLLSHSGLGPAMAELKGAMKH